VIGSLAMGVPAAMAATNATSTGTFSALVTAIATKFNLNPSDVQTVVNQVHTDQQATRQATAKTKLDQAVTDGALTQAQEDLIVAKWAEEQTFQESLQSMTATQRQAAIRQHRTDLQDWAKTNNIPLQYLRPQAGHRMGMMHGANSAPTDTTQG